MHARGLTLAWVMRTDKLTVKAQEALQEAQAEARKREHQAIDLEHLLLALLHQQDGVARPAARAHRRQPRPGREPARGRAARRPQGARRRRALPRQPAAEAARPGRGRGEEAQGRVRLHRAPARGGRRGQEPAPARRCAPPAPRADRIRGAREGHARRRPGHEPGGGEPVPRAREVREGPHRAGPQGQARPGRRPRRGDPAHHPDPLPPHQEQPGAGGRPGRGQDRHRRGAGPPHRGRRRARGAEGQAASSRSTWARSWPAPSTAASSRSGSRRC